MFIALSRPLFPKLPILTNVDDVLEVTSLTVKTGLITRIKAETTSL